MFLELYSGIMFETVERVSKNFGSSEGADGFCLSFVGFWPRFII